jgi:hypothetical protein
MDPDSDPQRQPDYPQQYPPQYPQQYPPPAYPPPYYMPYAPPKKNDKTLLIVVVVIIAVFVVVPIILSAVLYSMVTGFEPRGMVVPTGTWGAKTIVSNTAVNVDFGKINPESRPVDLEIILVRNGTAEGIYMFTSNDDGPLILTWGEYVGTLTYADLADNQRINIGDQLKMTNLHPNSDYRLMMIWVPTGDQITSTTFSTP